MSGNPTRPLLLLAALGSGCAVTPPYVAPELASPTAWVASPAAAAAAPLASIGKRGADEQTWWTAFDDATLTGLIDTAGRENLDVQRAIARLREARAGWIAAASRSYPDLTGGIEAERGNSATPGLDRTRSGFDARFDARWELDLFGATRSRTAAAVASAEAAKHDVDAVRLSLRAEVARNYVELRAAQNQLQLALDTLSARRDTAALVQSLHDAGLKSELDVSQANAQVLALAAEIPVLRAAVSAAARRIDTLLGRPPGTYAADLAVPTPVPMLTRPAVLDAPAAVLGRRPDLQRAERTLAAASALGAAAVADLYPKVSLAALFGLRDLSGGPAYSIASLAGGLAAPIFNAGRLRAEADAADARREQALLSYAQAALAAFEEVEVNLVGYLSAEQNRQALEALVANETHRLALAAERYAKGLAPFSDVLDAQRALLAAEAGRVTAAAAVAQGYVALNKALGG